MKAEIVLVTYQVEMSVPEYIQLDSNDYLTVVKPKLKSLGAINVEYDGHFGAMVQFEAEPDTPTAPIVAAIKAFTLKE